MTIAMPAGSAALPRIEALDALRGVALFGILAVNLPFLASTFYAEPVAAGPADAVALWFVAFAGQAKFFLLFSFLFGVGLAVQLDGAASRGERLGPAYARRLVGLFVFGAVHAVFLFVGDILTIYAGLGVVLWAVRAWPVRRLVRLAGAALAVSVVCYAALGWAAVAVPVGDVTALAAEADRAYGGSFLDAAGQRLRDLPVVYPFLLVFNGPAALAMFALGLAAGKAGVFTDPDRFWPRIRRAVPATLAVGVVGNAAYAFATAGPPGDAPAWAAASVMALAAVSAPALAFVYGVAVLAAVRSGRFGRVLSWLQSAGRMLLTNYMGESLVAGFLFGGWGLGLFGQVGPAGCLLLTPVVYGVLVAFSRVWMRSFRYGPEEWLLRSWTKARWQPFRAGGRRRQLVPRGAAVARVRPRRVERGPRGGPGGGPVCRNSGVPRARQGLRIGSPLARPPFTRRHLCLGSTSSSPVCSRSDGRSASSCLRRPAASASASRSPW